MKYRLADDKEIGRRLAISRKSEGWSLEEMAEKTGVSTSSIAKWECGVRKPSDSIKNRLCDLFDVSFETLFLVKVDEVRK